MSLSVHPSPSASDGRRIEQSTYIKKSDRLDQFIECGQCGFLVDLSKRSTGPSLGAVPDPTLTSTAASPPSPGIAFTDSYGDPVDSNSGCPFCNSMNPQAKGRDSDPFTVNIQNIENL